MPGLFFAGDIGDIQRLQVRYVSEYKVPLWNGRRKGKGLERVCSPLLESKAKPLPPKQSVKFTCQMLTKITKKSF